MMSRLINAFEQFFDASGEPLVNGKLYFYETGSSSALKDTYADSGETIPNSNPVILNADGRCPNVFGVGSYRVILTNANSVQLVQRDPVGGVDSLPFGADWDSTQTYSITDVVRDDGLYWQSVVSGNINNQPSIDDGSNWERAFFSQAEIIGLSGITVQTLGELQGISTGDGISVYMEHRSALGDGGGGEFYWDGSNLSTEVSADEMTLGGGDGGIYIAPNADKTGASGAWVRRNDGYVSPQFYGAITGGADQSAAVQKAIDIARASYNTTTQDFDYHLDFIGETFYTTASIDVTLVRQPGLIIKNGGLYGAVTGKIVLDLAGSNTIRLIDFMIYGDETSTPDVGIYYGRADVSGSFPAAANIILENAFVRGYYRKACVINFASEVSTHSNCFFQNKARFRNSYVYANVGHAATLDTYLNSSLTSDYATLPVAADGSFSNILHYEQNTKYLHNSDVSISIINITNANPAVLSVDPTALTNSELVNGDSVYLYNVEGMTEINGSNYTIANINLGAGTFELSGVDSTAYGVFTSGTLWNTTGPAVLFNGNHRTYWEAVYALTYGEETITVDLDNGGTIRDCVLGLHAEHDPIRIFDIHRDTSVATMQKLTVNLLNSSQRIGDSIFRHSGTGSVSIDGLDISVASMPSAPANGIFANPANFSLHGANIYMPLNAAINDPTTFASFTGKTYAADTDVYKFYGVSQIGFAENPTALTAIGMKWNSNSLIVYNDSVLAERQVQVRDAATTAQLTDITDRVNTEDKYQLKTVWNVTTGRPVWASGGSAGSVWVDSTGATLHTPV